jgi:hypothetical protein
MVVPHVRSRRGVGDVASFNQNLQSIGGLASAGAAITVSTLVAMGSITGPVGAAIGAAAAGIILAGQLIAKQFEGCGQTCVVASQDADQVATYLTQNLQAYQSAPIRYASLQAGALNNVDTAFTALRQACSDPNLGAAGQRCISERLVRGGTAPWCPNPGNTGCDWYALFRDPIANDPSVVPDPSPVSSAGSSLLSAVGIDPNATLNGHSISELALPVALLVAAWIFS